MAFAFVALVAVSLTTWLILGAVFDAQRQLFDAGVPQSATGTFRPRWDESGFASARETFRGITRTSFLAALLSAGLAAVAAGFVTRVLTRPLVALTDGARRLAAGERGLRLELPAAHDELRVLTEAFNGLASGLERQEAWRRGMVADIAHDLRTPLAVMRSEIEAMQDGVVALDGTGLTRLHAEVMMLARLVDDLRTLSLVEGGGLSLRPQLTPVEPFLQRLLGAFGARAAEVGATLRLGPVPDGLSATFDPDRITQVLSNLLDNALRHAGGVLVEVGAEPEAGGVKLWVRDHGPGLSQEALERLFERFYRGDLSRARGSYAAQGDSSGSGLGLAIARALTEAHGGRLEASNHPEGGARFMLYLPGPGHKQGVPASRTDP